MVINQKQIINDMKKFKYFFVFLLFLFHFLINLTKGYTQGLPLLQERALLILYNNIDSFPLISLDLLNNYNTPKIVYYYTVVNDTSEFHSYYMNNYLWKYLEKTKDSVLIRDENELSIKNISECFILKKGNNIAIYNSKLNKDLKLKKGDLSITILKEFYYNENYYVKLYLNSEGSIIYSDIIMKFSNKGILERIVFRQGEK